jgi:putative transposase
MKAVDVMILVERHAFKRSDKEYAELDNLCFLSKNLYNSTLYAIRQHFFNTGEYLGYNAVNADFTHNSQPDYTALPRKVSKLTQMLVDKAFKSFFALVKAKKDGKLDADFKVRIPKYLDSVKGRQVVEYTKQALSFLEKGFIKLSGTSIKIRTDKENVNFIRVVPKENKLIMVEVGYEQPLEYKETGNTAAIDLGINNLATITSDSFSPFIVNGKPLKSINQFYNKRLAELKPKQDLSGSKRKTTNRINILTRKRNSKVDDYLHKASREITNHLVSNDVNTLVIGYNKGWKQDVNLGKVNNQKFVQIPFLRFIQMLEYKCALVGITVELRNEAYTSKCSFLDNEEVEKHKTYQGNRIKRGLFKSSDGSTVNADVNASFNILKQYLQEKVAWNLELFKNCVEVCSTPSVFTVKL